jgi:hypothetical protein
VIPGPLLPIGTILSIADVNGAEFFAVHVPSAVPNSHNLELEWFPRTSGQQTTSVHKTRCRDGVQGVEIKTANATYKKCPSTEDELRVASTFPLPPYLCQETCDKTAKCVGYTVDAAGQNCWVLSCNTGAVNFDTFWKTGTQ